ncbi:hypothetical protein A1E_05210 [Rickettsia canadensis str. McKiel]|uniref:Uncharacterized protein n=2 Tax=Rickettsia canadensis TaxID=788 RepID=A8F025_RICCK|nr:hypothetical protein A1E_05210 [Rickettsia canadensis str. McKiel]AFB21515.1 hypothetical protein RCA_04830 [Rickettsia canadensis str. CA410]
MVTETQRIQLQTLQCYNKAGADNSTVTINGGDNMSIAEI